MNSNITLDPITKRFTQIIPPKKTCCICPSDIFVDDHHIDLNHGKISDKTVPLCRRCHHTIGIYNGIHMFEDEYLDKAIEVFNMTQSLLNKPLMVRDKIKRSDYWLKKHRVKEVIILDSNTKKFVQGRLFDEDCNL